MNSHKIGGLSFEGVSLHVRDMAAPRKFSALLPGASVESQRPGRFAQLIIGSGTLRLAQIKTPMQFHLEFNTNDLEATHGVRPTCASWIRMKNSSKSVGPHKTDMRALQSSGLMSQ